MEITKAEAATREQYHAAKPAVNGNLHERMQRVMTLAWIAQLHKSHRDLWDAIQALQLEVKYHKPADPPYAHRAVGH